MLFVKSDGDAARRLALSQSALDDLLADARSLRRTLSGRDQKTLDEYLQSVRDTEIKVEKAKRWMNIPCLLYTSPSPRDRTRSRMPSSA